MSQTYELPSNLIERARYISLANQVSFNSNKQACTVSSSSSSQTYPSGCQISCRVCQLIYSLRLNSLEGFEGKVANHIC
jgi:hypothetical protein